MTNTYLQLNGMNGDLLVQSFTSQGDSEPTLARNK